MTGTGGTLLPERYRADRMHDDLRQLGVPATTPAELRRISAWWVRVASSCGPASAIRTLFDMVAMPLCALLGYRAREVVFTANSCRARLETTGGTPVALLLTTWAVRPPSRWADLARHAHDMGAAWGFVLAPPFLSLIATRGHATRRSLDFALPLIDEIGNDLMCLAQARVFEYAGGGASSGSLPLIEQLLRRGEGYQDGVRNDLQRGVEMSLRVLRPVVARLQQPMRRGHATRPRLDHSPTAHLDESLTFIYRILFLLFAESRHLVPYDDPVYRRAYAVSGFCRAAMDGDGQGLWDALAATTRLSRAGCHSPDLVMSPFNGALFARAAAPTLEQRRTTRPRGDSTGRDEALRGVLVALGSRAGRAGIETINYRDLGVEQLGAVYQRVLDLDPAVPDAPPASSRGTRSNHSARRKQTGTFYTPQPLADFVVRRTLSPMVDGATSDAILALRILDPAMGSGAFLVSACRFLAHAYEDAVVAEGRMAPSDVDDEERAGMRRLIAERCLCGVDRNPTAVHLARLSLWLATLSRDKPLNFLDHRLRVGDSLLGAWPSDLGHVSMHPSRVRAAALPLLDACGFEDTVREATAPLLAALARHDDTVNDVRAKEADWRRFVSRSSPLQPWRLAADVWCARWFPAPGASPPSAAETRALFDFVLRHDRDLPARQVDRRLDQAAAAARRQQFFHWPLEFPDVFHDSDGRSLQQGGFDAVIGNPPWEMWRRDDGTEQRHELLHYIRQSGQYPSCTSGHLNLYQAFVDRALSLVRQRGRIGLVLPWGIAADDGAAPLRRRLFRDSSVDTVVGLDNGNGLFPIHRGLRFAVVTSTMGRATREFRARFGVKSGAELEALPSGCDSDAYPVRMWPDELEAATGPSIRIPDVRRSYDLDLLTSLSRRFQKLGAADGWAAHFGRELNATEVRSDLDGGEVPVIEGKHLAPFTVDITQARRIDADRLCRFIDPARLATARLGYRDVSGVGNRLTLIAAVIPAGMVTTHTVFCLKETFDAVRQHFLCALFNSYVLSTVVRLLMGGHVTTTLAEHLPVPPWRGDATDRRIAALAVQLSERRGRPDTAGRLQALVARRFGLTGAELAHVLDGVPLVPLEERTRIIRLFESL